MAFKLRPHKSELAGFIARYGNPQPEVELLKALEHVTRRGYLTKGELGKLARWKSPRSAPRIQTNTPSFVEEVTAFAFTARDERARIESLTILDGVGWPTASVVLHLFHRDLYPMLDFRALWSVSAEVPAAYTFDFWWEYVGFCRGLAEKFHLSMRSLDRGLWQCSKERQRPGT